MLTFLKYFLMVIGGLFLLLVVAVAVAIVWFRWKMRKLVGEFGDSLDALDAAGPPPFRVKLEPVGDVNWEDAAKVDALLGPLYDAGFTDIGTFVIGAIDARLQAVKHDARSVYAVVYEHPQIGTWADLVTLYEDGSVWTYATARDDLLDRPEHRTARFFEGHDTGGLLERLLKDRPDKPTVPVSAEEFPEVFETAYAEEMDFRIERGGPVEAEIRRIAERDGTDCTPEMVEGIRESWQAAINEFLEERLTETYLRDAKISASDWERQRDRIVFVHDKLTPEDLVEVYERGIDWEDEDEAEKLSADAEEQSERGRPREIFVKLNEQLDSGRRFEPIGQIESPVPADVYLAPDEDDEDWD